MKAFTDYPFEELGDIPGSETPIREVEVLVYDENKYCTVKVEGIITEVKSGYLYTKHGREGQVPCLSAKTLRILIKNP